MASTRFRHQADRTVGGSALGASSVGGWLRCAFTWVTLRPYRPERHYLRGGATPGSRSLARQRTEFRG
jgi:uncharacterized Fe-S cluster-containing radical SAM superfamily protein